MFRPDSLTLGAYVDGELDAATAAEVEAATAADPAAQRELDQLLKLAATVRVAYDDRLHEPVPDNLVTAILEHQPEAATPAAAPAATNVVPLRRAASTQPPYAWAMAAAVALVIGFAGANVLDRQPAQTGGLTAAHQAALGQAVNHALETLPNGEPAPINIDSRFVGSVMPLRTYVNAEGRYCRDYVVSLAGGSGNETACRTDSGEWKKPSITDASFSRS